MLLGQNVLTCGADPTGHYDSTPAFRAAIEALPDTGGIVYIPAGRYRLQTLTLQKTVSLLGAGGVARTGGPAGGSATTLVFPSDADGIVLEAGGVRIENLAIMRAGAGYARRGIYAPTGFFARNLYLVRWERGIELDGRLSEGNNINGFRMENIFAEDCYWATYTRGYDAQGGHFSHVYAFQCEAGIYDSSQTGNGYTDCYVEGSAYSGDVPYYIDNGSQLRNCHSESPQAAQIGIHAQVIGGSFNGPDPALVPPERTPDVPGGRSARNFLKSVVGIPARIDSFPFSDVVFDGSEQLSITIDGVSAVVHFDAGPQTPSSIAEKINLAFPGSPPVALVDVFDSTISIRGRLPYAEGKIMLAEPSDGSLLSRLHIPVAENTGLNRAQILMPGEVSGVVFKGSSNLGHRYEDTQLLEVQVAPHAGTALLWQARGFQEEGHEYALIRIKEDMPLPTGAPPETPPVPWKRRWAFAFASSELGAALAFTQVGDVLGPAQMVSYQGIWLHGNPPLLLCNGVPAATQGQIDNCAWDMSQNPPRHYVKTAEGWVMDA